MSSCRNTECPGAHGEGGTRLDPDHLVIHSHARRNGRGLSESVIPTAITIHRPPASEFVQRCAAVATGDQAALDRYHADMRARAARAVRTPVDVPAKARAARGLFALNRGVSK